MLSFEYSKICHNLEYQVLVWVKFPYMTMVLKQARMEINLTLLNILIGCKFRIYVILSGYLEQELKRAISVGRLVGAYDSILAVQWDKSIGKTVYFANQSCPGVGSMRTPVY